MKKNLLLIFTLFTYCLTQAQTAEIDSLKLVFNQENDTDEKAR